jgi:hypothetical protein
MATPDKNAVKVQRLRKATGQLELNNVLVASKNLE